MKEFFEWLEQTQFSQWVVSSPSIWAYPTILFLHSVGMITVVGVCAAIDIRLLGAAPRIPIRPLERLYPIMWLGFALTALTGLTLTIADATTKLYNPDFWVKMVFVLASVWLLHRIRQSVFKKPGIDQTSVPSSARLLAWASLICWFAAIVTGRLLAYLGPVSGGGGLSNH